MMVLSDGSGFETFAATGKLIGSRMLSTFQSADTMYYSCTPCSCEIMILYTGESSGSASATGGLSSGGISALVVTLCCFCGVLPSGFLAKYLQSRRAFRNTMIRERNLRSAPRQPSRLRRIWRRLFGHSNPPRRRRTHAHARRNPFLLNAADIHSRPFASSAMDRSSPPEVEVEAPPIAAGGGVAAMAVAVVVEKPPERHSRRSIAFLSHSSAVHPFPCSYGITQPQRLPEAVPCVEPVTATAESVMDIENVFELNQSVAGASIS